MPTRKEVLEIGGREVSISNPDKVYFPETGYTKMDVVSYYLSVADGALRGAGGRPMALKRFVDGSTWRGSGLAQLNRMAAAAKRFPIAISDFAMVRQSRWREAIAAIFDIPDFLPYLRHIRRIAVTYGVRDEFGAESTNIVKPIYHAAWIASRLGMDVVQPLAPMTVGTAARRATGRTPGLANPSGGLGATLHVDRTD